MAWLKRWVWDEGWLWTGVAAGTGLAAVWFCLLHTTRDAGGLVVFSLIVPVVLFAPGLFVMKLGRYEGDDVLGGAVTATALSLSITTAVMFALYSAGLYTRGVMLAVLAAMAVGGVWAVWPLRVRHFVARVRDGWHREDWLGRITVILFALYFLVALGRFTGQPLTKWDAIVSWDKWACDMAERNGLGAYSLGGYPQLFPTIGSIFYKTAGTFLDGIPDTQLLLHGFMLCYPLLLLAATVRTCRLLGVPWPPAVWLLFGHHIIRDRIAAGYADVPSVAMGMASLAVLLGALRGRWRLAAGPYPTWTAVGCVLFGAGFTKGHGLIWVLGLNLFAVFASCKAGRIRMVWRPLAACMVVCLVLLAPFYLHQEYLAHHPEQIDRASRLLSFPVQVARKGLFEATPVAAMEKMREFAAAYSSPAGRAAGPVLGVILVVCLCAGLTDPRMWPWLGMASVFLWVWFTTSSYDWRNMLPAIPLLSMVTAAGIRQLSSLARGHRRLVVPLAGAAVIVLFSGEFLGSIVRDAPVLVRSFRTGRFGLWPVEPVRRLKLVNRGWYELRRIVEESPTGMAAPHIYASTPLYRYLGQRGVYTSKLHAFTERQSGDLLVEEDSAYGVTKFTPLCELDGLQAKALHILNPVFRDSAYTITNAHGIVAAKDDDNGAWRLTGKGYVDIRVDALQDLPARPSAAVKVVFDRVPDDISLSLHPDLEAYTSFCERFRSVQVDNAIQTFFWLDREPDAASPDILLRITKNSTDSINLRHLRTDLPRKNPGIQTKVSGEE